MSESDNNKQSLSLQLLVNDFQQCMSMIQHYDEVNWNLTKFAFGQVLVSIGACWTIFYEIGKQTGNSILQDYGYWGIFIILVLSAAFSYISVLGICKNRTYFVFVSHYLNELRQYAIANNLCDFRNISGMWDNPQLPKVKDKGSTQMICLYLLCGCCLLELILSDIVISLLTQSSCRGIAIVSIVSVAVFLLGFVGICNALKEK